MITTVLLILGLAAVLVPLVRRDVARARARRHPPLVVTLTIDTDAFVEALRKMAAAAEDAARAFERLRPDDDGPEKPVF